MNTSSYLVIFVTDHLYYIPQFLPVAKELKSRQQSFLFLLMGKDSPAQNQIAFDSLQNLGYDTQFYNEETSQLSCKFLISGSNGYPMLKVSFQYSCLIVHGIGTKAGYYTEEQNKHHLRFVEGQHRVDKIRELFPDVKSELYNVGFAKLDGIFDIKQSDKDLLFSKMGFDKSKPTLLYAPTFYPSSIDKMPKSFPVDFKDYNIIVKPHFFSFLLKTYKHHLKKFDIWKKYTNVYFAGVEEYNLVPFMAVADLMISDESSAIFEFAALNKPVICNRNVKYRWTYRLFKSKIRKRMDVQMDQFRDVATPIYNYNALLVAVKYEIDNPNVKAASRKEISEQIVGTVDGKVSQRIVDILLNHD